MGRKEKRKKKEINLERNLMNPRRLLVPPKGECLNREVVNFIFGKQQFNKLVKVVFVSCLPAAALQYIHLL